jgi:hypothetical protein
MKTPPRKTPKRSGSEEYCGLTAEITRELKFRTPRKTPHSSKSGGNGVGGGGVGGTSHAMVVATPPPASRRHEGDIFRAPFTEPKLMIPPTISMSSSDDTSSLKGGSTDNTDPLLTMKAPSSSSSQPPVPPPLAPSTKKKRTLIGTPMRLARKKTSSVTFLSAKKKLKKCLTPPREGFGSHLKERLRNGSSRNGMNGGSPNSFSTSLPGLDDFKMTSTELDPSDFQCELPSKREFTVHSKICSLVDDYTTIHLNFNFAMLAGLTRNTLENEHKRSTAENPMIAGSCHRDVVAKILDCADDLVVEGFFRAYVGEGSGRSASATTNGVVAAPGQGAANSKDDRIEAIVFSSEKLRQLIVCFRGSTANQAKPLRTNFFGKEGEKVLCCHALCILSLLIVTNRV